MSALIDGANVSPSLTTSEALTLIFLAAIVGVMIGSLISEVLEFGRVRNASPYSLRAGLRAYFSMWLTVPGQLARMW